MPSVYILKCKDNRYYTGSTVDLNNRYQEHLLEKCKFTKSRLPIEIVHTEKYETYSEAGKREYQIKGYKSRSLIEKLIKLGSIGAIV
ncbi:GIY-YIG nuclease family protein [Candidatus Collierbacteria bacterium]|nr:GIY-YIG nuclease family protein [Candidatus Collierbacteria bacterium]